MDQKEYEAKMRKILDREVNTEEDSVRRAEELMTLDVQYLMKR